MVIEEEEEEEEEGGQSACENHVYQYFITRHPFFCTLLLFHMFSTLMSLEVRLN